MQWCLSKDHSVLDASVIFALHRAVLGGHLFCLALFCLCPASLDSAYSGESKPHTCPGGSEVFPQIPSFTGLSITALLVSAISSCMLHRPSFISYERFLVSFLPNKFENFLKTHLGLLLHSFLWCFIHSLHFYFTFGM